MRVVLYEWCCSGGWQGPDAARMQCGDDRAATALQQSALMAEGWAMLSALARDAVRDPKLAVTVLVGEDALSTMTTAAPLPAGACRICRVSPGAELDILLHEAVRADWTVIVAPETAGLLASRVEAVRMAGGRAAACGGGFIAVAADKQLTANALAAAGVPVPAGRSLAADEPLPAFFRLPAVRKARGSVGCDDLVVVGARGQLLPPTTGRWGCRVCAVRPASPRCRLCASCFHRVSRRGISAARCCRRPSGATEQSNWLRDPSPRSPVLRAHQARWPRRRDGWESTWCSAPATIVVQTECWRSIRG